MNQSHLSLCLVAGIFFILFTTISSNHFATAALTVNKIQSGLVASDSLTNETMTQQQLQANQQFWTYSGDAPNEHANYTFYRDTQGLHIGAQAPSNGTYAGFYAETPNSNATLYHAVIISPVNTIPSNGNTFQNGLYVQTSAQPVNYVTCVSVTTRAGTYWEVADSYGSPFGAAAENSLWVDSSSNQPLTRDCTIITNGENYLKVYLDGKMVYTSNTLVLAMPSPFNAYLEPQSSYAGQLLTGTYTDYYMTSDENIKVTNNPSNAATVTVTDSSGNVLASAPVSSGTATINVGQYHFPLAANINVYDSSNTLIATTSGIVNIYGGDVYSIGGTQSNTPPSSPTGLTATATSSSQINLSWTAPSSNGGSPITGYKIERSTDSGTTWSTVVPNTNSTATTYSDAGLQSSTTYTYRVSAINSVGTSTPSNTASATTSGISNPTGIVLNNVQSTSGTASLPPYQITLANFNAGTGTDRLLVVGVSANNNIVASITFGGTKLTQAKSSFSNNDAEFWYLKNPSGTANIVVTMSGSTSAVVGAYSFSGVNQTNPIPTSVTKHNIVASSPTISITTVYPNSWVLDLPSIYGGVTLSKPTCTQQWDINMPSAITGASSSIIKASPGQTTCSWTASNSDDWDDVAIELKADVTTSSGNATIPGSPTGLTATATSSSQINLSWTAPSSNGGSPITGYKIERSTDSGTTWSTVVSNTASTATTYSDAGLQSSTTYTYRVSAINSVGTSTPSNTASATTANTQSIFSITQVTSGLLQFDSLSNETMTQQQLQANQQFWKYGGDAPLENAPYNYSRDTQGLHIGVQAPSNGTYAGYYAISPNTNGTLFHAIVSSPTRTIPSNNNFFQNGLYVQTSSPTVSYVTCVAITSNAGTTWSLVHTYGSPFGSLVFQSLWTDSTPNQPLTRDCTIVTNGQNSIKLYLDGALVYSSDTVALGMPSPFNAFLEPQSNYAGQEIFGTYTDYYATSSESIKVINLPSNAARVDLVSQAGTVLASSQVTSNSATMSIGQYTMPLGAYIKAYNTSNLQIGSSQMLSIFGGDVYSATS